MPPSFLPIHSLTSTSVSLFSSGLLMLQPMLTVFSWTAGFCLLAVFSIINYFPFKSLYLSLWMKGSFFCLLQMLHSPWSRPPFRLTIADQYKRGCLGICFFLQWGYSCESGEYVTVINIFFSIALNSRIQNIRRQLWICLYSQDINMKIYLAQLFLLQGIVPLTHAAPNYFITALIVYWFKTKNVRLLLAFINPLFYDPLRILFCGRI